MSSSWRGSARTGRAAIAGCLALLMAGCYQLPGDGPLMGPAAAGSSEALPYDVVDLTPATVGAYKAVARIDRPSTMPTLSFGGRQTAAAGDVLLVRIFQPREGGLFPPTTREGGELGFKRVSDDGVITLPFIGAVRVAGLDTGEIQRRILAQLGNRAPDAQVVVEFAADRSNTASVSGDVAQPGQVPVYEGARTVVEAINVRGGILDERDRGREEVAPTDRTPGTSPPVSSPTTQRDPMHTEIVVRRNGKVILVAPYSNLLAGGDIPIEKGDEIIVRSNEQTFIAIGAVRQAGNYPLSRQGMTLAEALGAISGLVDARSDKTGVYVFRLASDPAAAPRERSKIFRLDLSQPQSILIAQLFGIQPRDVLYVANAPLHEYDKVLTYMYRTVVTYGAVKAVIPATTVF